MQHINTHMLPLICFKVKVITDISDKNGQCIAKSICTFLGRTYMSKVHITCCPLLVGYSKVLFNTFKCMAPLKQTICTLYVILYAVSIYVLFTITKCSYMNLHSVYTHIKVQFVLAFRHLQRKVLHCCLHEQYIISV